MTPAPILRALALCAAAGAVITAPVAMAEITRLAAAQSETAAPEDVSPPLSPEAEAFRALLTPALAGLPADTGAAIDGFYASRDYRPYWSTNGAAPVAALAAAMDGSAAHGLPADRYDAAALRARFADPAGDLAAREVAATRAYLTLAGDTRAGVVRPGAADGEIGIAAPDRDPALLLAALDAAGAPDAALAQLEPADPDYRRLVAEKARLEGLLGTGARGAEIPDGPTLRPGESSPRVADLRGRLDRLGYPAPAGEMPATAFDPGLEAALKRFQSDHGLIDDGMLGRRTLAALNASVEDRLRQVVVNLERLRWMNRDLGARHITVNIPDYSVRMVEGGAEVYRTRAVVGMARETRTPEFSDVMSYMVVNPTWHIPDSIATRVYLPKLRKDPNVLADSNMRLFTRSGVEINPRLVDFNQYTAESFPFRIKQNPSAANALGRVKFMFPNQYAIYLHDTPARDLFARDARAFSNGCVRLEDPLELAHILLDGQVANPVVAFDDWLASKVETHVSLDRPIPVHILYRTVWSEPDGTVRYRADVYGRDARVFDALAAAGVRLPAAEG